MPLALFLLVIALHLWLVWVGPLPGDHWALRQHVVVHPLLVRDFANVYEQIGNPQIALAIVAVALAVLVARTTLAETTGLLVACCAVPLNALLKLIFGASPLWRTMHHSSRDYPSGHVTFVVAVIGYLGVIAWRHDRRWLTAIAGLLIISVGPARVVTGIHLVSDAIAGYLLGTAMLLLALRVATPRKRTVSQINTFARSANSLK